MSMTPDQRKVGLGVMPSPSPFLTPRPERRRPESRGSELISNRFDRDKEVSVQVLLRCRPLSDEDQRSNIAKVVSCNEQKREATILQNLANKQVDKVFTFDKVFGPKAQQRSIYDQAISPIVKEVLEGFNCTVFAYGQTGTGKTYTMEGGMRNKGGDLPAEAGVIPRAVRHIFDTLEAQNADYNMKVTFLELYNEEITDLLAREESSSRFIDEKQKKPVTLMEDGKGSVIVRGLEEECVYSANEIYSLLERGAARRRTADTLLNKRSSRSHSVFTITVHVKDTAVGDGELIKCGKLNLVDLAGSENISRSGVREGRAREAGEINKSLLTLGRVINALVEHTSHVPYRDSKLTRLLRDSLGGKTKTCIIATISPSAHCLDETLSTLDYAYRAKNIKNRPEANQKMSKSVLLKDLYLEIGRMKEDVRAAREKNGVYVPHERFMQEEAEKKARSEKIEQLENDLILSKKQVDRFKELYHAEREQKLELESELNDCKMSLDNSNKELLDLQEKHEATNTLLHEKELYISKLQFSESSLIQHAKHLCTDLQNASEDINSLFARLDHKDRMEAGNQSSLLSFGSHLDQSLKYLHKVIVDVVAQQEQEQRCMEAHICSFLASKCDATKVMKSKIQEMAETYNSGAATLKELALTLQRKTSSNLEEINSTVLAQTMAVDNFLATMASDAESVMSDIQSSISEQQDLLAFSTQIQQKGLQRNLNSAQVISKATVDFFDDLQLRASRVITMHKEQQKEKSNLLADFEKKFKEETAKEEKEALEKIAVLLSTLTSKKTARVSEASRNMLDFSTKETRILELEVSDMQQVSSRAKKELNKYIEKVESDFMGDTFSAAEYRAILETGLKQCSDNVDKSRQLWENAESSMKTLNDSNMRHVDSIVKENIRANETIHEQYLSKSAYIDSDLDAGSNYILAALDESLEVDHRSKNEIDAMTNICMDQLRSVQDMHNNQISDIHNHTEKYLTKEYLVDQHTGRTPKKRVFQVPSLTSIEEMRTPGFEDLKGDKTRTKRDLSDSRIPRLTTTPIRAPFADIN